LISNGLSTNTNNVMLPLMMSSQTFRIVLRQALLTVFADQAMVQFMCPKPRTTLADNIFVPFVVSAGSYAAPNFGQLKFPLLLAENLKMLKTKVLRLEGTKTKVIHIPVLGMWNLDTYTVAPKLLTPTTFPVEGNDGNIFAITPDMEVQINLLDGSLSSASQTQINLNSMYYQTAVNTLNTLFGNFTATGGTLSGVSGDDGPGLSLLNFTRYVQTVPPESLAKVMRPGELLVEHYERVTQVKKVKSQGKIEKRSDSVPVEKVRPTDYNYERQFGPYAKMLTNPSGSTSSNITIAISSNSALYQDVQDLLKRLILPNIRPDPDDSTYPQIVSEWQVAYFEPNSAQYNIGGMDSISSSFRQDDIVAAATSAIASILNGKQTDDIILSLEQLVRDGKGPDWLAILGGVVGAGLQIAKAF